METATITEIEADLVGVDGKVAKAVNMAELKNKNLAQHRKKISTVPQVYLQKH